MRTRIGLWLALCLGVGLATAAAQMSIDPVVISPDTHRVVIDNPYVRVLEVRVVQGQKVGMHSHPANAIISLAPARVKFTLPDGKTQLVDMRAGEVIWSDAGQHAGEVLAGTVVVIQVEFKGPKPTTAMVPKDKDPAALWPDMYRTVLDNAHARVLEIRAGAGQKTPMHSHPAAVIVNVGAYRVKFTYPDGKTEVLDSRPGQAMWVDKFDHAADVLVGAVHVIVVELKGAPAAARP